MLGQESEVLFQLYRRHGEYEWEEEQARDALVWMVSITTAFPDTPDPRRAKLSTWYTANYTNSKVNT